MKLAIATTLATTAAAFAPNAFIAKSSTTSALRAESETATERVSSLLSQLVSVKLVSVILLLTQTICISFLYLFMLLL